VDNARKSICQPQDPSNLSTFPPSLKDEKMGRFIWSVLHSFVDAYPVTPSLNDVRRMKTFLDIFLTFIPPVGHSQWPHSVELSLKTVHPLTPSDDDLSSHCNLVGWCNRWHNLVNVLLHKATLSNECI
jgi:hypothetical protein